MKTRIRGWWSGAAIAALLSVPSLAGPINLNPGDTVPANAGDATVTAWLSGLIETYNTVTPASLPTPPVLTFHSNNEPIPPGYPENDGTSVVLPMGDYLYVVLKWGGGFNPGTFSAYYIGDVAEAAWTFSAPSQQALSGYRLYTRIPDGGGALGMLGVAMAILGIARRWL